MEDFRLPKRSVVGQRNRCRLRRRFLDTVTCDLRERDVWWGIETSRLDLDEIA